MPRSRLRGITYCYKLNRRLQTESTAPDATDSAGVDIPIGDDHLRLDSWRPSRPSPSHHAGTADADDSHTPHRPL
ncbi:hypothetical protein HBB16_00065 [Pseudonocardia sp. MCCB 268]|nr:hypothetical protein [Pseudonocardia cytotoxica]